MNWDTKYIPIPSQLRKMVIGTHDIQKVRTHVKTWGLSTFSFCPLSTVLSKDEDNIPPQLKIDLYETIECRSGT